MTHNSQSGNALWFILIAIVLLGGLTVLMSRSSGTSDDAGDYERGQIDISELSRYAKSLELAVQNLKTNNKCSENDLNFDSADVANDDNPSAPVDESCDIFSDKGAGLAYRPIPTKFLDPTHSGETLFGHWVFNGSLDVAGHGTSGAAPTDNRAKELLVIAPFITKDLCLALNKFYGISAISGDPPKEDNTNKAHFLSQFTGNFGGGIDIDGNGNASGLQVFYYKSAGCTTATDENTYFFYQILIAR